MLQSLKSFLIISLSFVAIFLIMFELVYKPDRELDKWCKDFMKKDDGSIDEPLMHIIRDKCK